MTLPLNLGAILILQVIAIDFVVLTTFFATINYIYMIVFLWSYAHLQLPCKKRLLFFHLMVEKVIGFRLVTWTMLPLPKVHYYIGLFGELL
jgi:hypothetical protein